MTKYRNTLLVTSFVVFVAAGLIINSGEIQLGTSFLQAMFFAVSGSVSLLITALFLMDVFHDPRDAGFIGIGTGVLLVVIAMLLAAREFPWNDLQIDKNSQVKSFILLTSAMTIVAFSLVSYPVIVWVIIRYGLVFIPGTQVTIYYEGRSFGDLHMIGYKQGSLGCYTKTPKGAVVPEYVEYAFQVVLEKWRAKQHVLLQQSQVCLKIGAERIVNVCE